ncbi:hypothetical protein [Aestuariispira insulae]|uniref:hypothetical protein n=1 Tax=Aestuariispira insulae TaxID=1461337 RepID=UPI001C3F5C3D|nr:hypothetical protein [Aestuariispira insulae]
MSSSAFIEVDAEMETGQVTGHRYFDKASSLHIIKVNQGNCYVSGREDEVLATVLGSCVAACIRDPLIGVGGMNHFMLPATDNVDLSSWSSLVSPELRYGNFAMEQLINQILKKGGDRRRLEIKVFGGGNVLNTTSKVGHKNADFVERYLHDEGFDVVSSDLRGDCARRIKYYPVSGRVQLQRLGQEAAGSIARTEQVRTPRIRPAAEEGSIELFD